MLKLRKVFLKPQAGMRPEGGRHPQLRGLFGDGLAGFGRFAGLAQRLQAILDLAFDGRHSGNLPQVLKVRGPFCLQLVRLIRLFDTLR